VAAKPPSFGDIEWFRKNPEMGKRYFPQIYESLVKQGLLNIVPDSMAVFKPKAANTNLVTINVRFRAVSLSNVEDPAANGRLAFAVADAFKNSDLFDPEGTRLTGELEAPENVSSPVPTFRFNMVLKLRNEMQM
jgi:hypothetical protein